ncbi:MAG TPA: FliM/FliN family flagellar motor C-terminal domain-containing protein [Sedimentisphaerales bacterium]|nr:FliM/FliN family flagellar motor C-terminal domain-containing protein [Sedimentisphaerales bacterium]
MSGSSSDNLSRQKMQQLLAAVGSAPAGGSPPADVSEYNWHEPHCFTREQLSKLDDFTKGLCKTIAAKFAALCPGDFSVNIDSTTQHFADKLFGECSDSNENDYYLAFGNSPDQPCGLIGIPAQTALGWATQLLGDTEQEKDTNRDLSQLEESLLLDAATAIIDAICEVRTACDFQPTGTLARRLQLLDLQGTEELCKVTFTVEKTGSDKTQAYLLMLCEAMEPVVGRAGQGASGASAKDISKALRGHLEQMSVFVTARLATTELTLRELMSLCPSDILLLDRKTAEPIELVIEGRPIFGGLLAKSSGKYAVVIAQDHRCVLSPLQTPESPHGTGRNTNSNKNS